MDNPIDDLIAENSELRNKLEAEERRATALLVDGDQREQRALAIVPDCAAHGKEIQYLRHVASWYWDCEERAYDAWQAAVRQLILAIRNLDDLVRENPDATVPAAHMIKWLKKATAASGKVIHRKGKYPTIADCINNGGCDHDGLSGAVKADIAETLRIPPAPLVETKNRRGAQLGRANSAPLRLSPGITVRA